MAKAASTRSMREIACSALLHFGDIELLAVALREPTGDSCDVDIACEYVCYQIVVIFVADSLRIRGPSRSVVSFLKA